MQEKTFREVIATIKEGEVWESENKEIRCFANGIKITHIEKGRCTPSMYMPSYNKYKLKRKEYTFEEAFKAYEEGKEIESIESGLELRKIEFGVEYRFKVVNEKWELLENDDATLTINEIRGKWYINN